MPAVEGDRAQDVRPAAVEGAMVHVPRKLAVLLAAFLLMGAGAGGGPGCSPPPADSPATNEDRGDDGGDGY